MVLWDTSQNCTQAQRGCDGCGGWDELKGDLQICHVVVRKWATRFKFLLAQCISGPLGGKHLRLITLERADDGDSREGWFESNLLFSWLDPETLVRTLS